MKRIVAWAAVLLLAVAGCTVAVQGGLEEPTANEVVSRLEQAGVPARKQRDEGSDPARYSVSVPQAEAARALTLLAALGLPRAEAHGFAQVYEQPSLIPSPTEERARFLRALSGELETTLNGVEGVVSSRVHIVPEERDPLAAPREPARVPARAAVLLRVRAEDVALSDDEVKSLIAGSVPGLVPSDVAIIRAATRPVPTGEPAWVALGPLRLAPGSRTTLLIGLGIGITLLAAMAVLLLLAARRLAAAERQGEAGR